MKNSIYSIALLLSVCMAISSCHHNTRSSDGSLLVPMRESIQKNSSISLKDDVAKVEYIPLETADSCLISNILSLQICKDYIFVYNGKTDQVLQFGRDGHFIRTVGRAGSGPGEYTNVNEIYADSQRSELYIFSSGRKAPLIYSFDGAFLRQDSTLQGAGGICLLPDGKAALKGLVMTPIQQAPWLVALRSADGKLLASRNPYPKSLNQDVCYMRGINFVPSSNSVLAFTPCNDTIFRVTTSGISAACILQRDNEKSYYTGVADISRLQDDKIESITTIGVYDFFETAHYFYFRVHKGVDLFVMRLDKTSGEMLSHHVPQDFQDCSRAIPGNNVVGLENDLDQGAPFWPEFDAGANMRAQVITADEIASLQSKGYLKNMPQALIIKPESNPVIAIYSFKQ